MATVWCALARRSGMLEIVAIPSFTSSFVAHNAASVPTLLVDTDVEGLPRSTSADAPPLSSSDRPAIVEILVAPIAHGTLPLLFIVLVRQF